MKRLLRWTFLATSLLATVSNLWGQVTCASVSGVAGVLPCVVTGSSTYVTALTCPTGYTGGGNPCGYAFNTTVNSLTAFNSAKNGWHEYQPASSAQSWSSTFNTFDTTTPVTFTSSVYTNARDGNGVPTKPWREPTNDNGYYLVVGGNAAVTPTTPDSLTIQIGTLTPSGSTTKTATGCNNCFNEFSLYWGSLDTWNTITFTDWSGQSVSLTGSQIATALNLGVLGQNDTASFVLDFQEPAKFNYWYQVTLSTTYPAFEFDNIEYGSVSGTCDTAPCSPEAPIHAPVPEPSSLFMLGAALCAGLVSLKGQLVR